MLKSPLRRSRKSVALLSLTSGLYHQMPVVFTGWLQDGTNGHQRCCFQTQGDKKAAQDPWLFGGSGFPPAICGLFFLCRRHSGHQ